MLLSGGCGLIHQNKGVIGTASRQTTALSAKVDAVDTQKAKINDQRLTSIGALSYGIAYTLQKDTNQSPPISVALEINERIGALANKPDFKELQAVNRIVDTLLTNKIAGEKLMAEKDKEIYSLNNNLKKSEDKKEELENQVLAQASKNASLSDQYKTTLSSMDSFWGFGAIAYGAKKFATNSLWLLGILLVLYLVLRFAASTNPIANKIFGLFEEVVSWGISGIKALAPKATIRAGLVEETKFEDWKGTLVHVIDSVALLKEKEKTGVDIKINDLMTELDKSMDQADKDRVTLVKQQLHWI